MSLHARHYIFHLNTPPLTSGGAAAYGERCRARGYIPVSPCRRYTFIEYRGNRNTIGRPSCLSGSIH